MLHPPLSIIVSAPPPPLPECAKFPNEPTDPVTPACPNLPEPARICLDPTFAKQTHRPILHPPSSILVPNFPHPAPASRRPPPRRRVYNQSRRRAPRRQPPHRLSMEKAAPLPSRAHKAPQRPFAPGWSRIDCNCFNRSPVGGRLVFIISMNASKR